MPKPEGLLANADKSSGGSSFKEGWLRCGKGKYVVHQGKSDPKPVVKFSLPFTRLDEDLEDIVDEATGEPLTDELLAGLGRASLAKMSPGEGTGPDDADPEDQGKEIGAEGNTIFVPSGSGANLIHEKSSYHKLCSSMKALGEKDELLEAHYGPLWEGAILYVWSQPDKDVMIMNDKTKHEEAINYKVVKEIHTGLGKGGKKKKADKGDTAKADKPSKSTADSDADDDSKTILLPILKKVAAEKSDESLSLKLFISAMSTALDTADVPAKKQIQLIELLRTPKFLNSIKLKGMTLDEKDGKVVSVSFE